MGVGSIYESVHLWESGVSVRWFGWLDVLTIFSDYEMGGSHDPFLGSLDDPHRCQGSSAPVDRGGERIVSSLTKYYEVWVWLNGKEENRQVVIIETVPPLTPMNVRDYSCRMNLFEWRDYPRIRYRRVSRKEEKK